MKDNIMEERKLESADIAIYLPYDLKFKVETDRVMYKSIYTLDMLSQELIYPKERHTRKRFTYGIHFKYCKPILRPMTDINKPIRHPDINGGEEFIPVDYWAENEDLGDEVVSSLMRVEGSITSDEELIELWRTKSYTCNIELQFLAKLHFDIHNLIGQGLAIDKNTIPNGE